jgi:hypothetical protein
MHGNIVNVPTNVNLLQNVLSQMLNDDYSITIFFKLQYISIYILGYVFLNTIMKTLNQLFETILYVETKVSIK